MLYDNKNNRSQWRGFEELHIFSIVIVSNQSWWHSKTGEPRWLWQWWLICQFPRAALKSRGEFKVCNKIVWPYNAWNISTSGLVVESDVPKFDSRLVHLLFLVLRNCPAPSDANNSMRPLRKIFLTRGQKDMMCAPILATWHMIMTRCSCLMGCLGLSPCLDWATQNTVHLRYNLELLSHCVDRSSGL
jgi:hypothetical protein